MSNNDESVADKIIQCIGVLIFIFIVSITLYCFFPKLSLDYKVNAAEIVIAIASLFVSAIAFWIQNIQAQTQKSQAITQLNQAFNDINKLVLSSNVDSYTRTFAETLYNSSQNGQNEYFLCDKERKEITPLIFIILNAYEAYYINNKKAFKSGCPLILKNLFTYYKTLANAILNKHSYDKGFIKACERISE